MPTQNHSDELNNFLKEQIEFLIASSRSFDSGFESESKRLATTIRVLLHDTKVSNSLLKQLNKKSIKFFSHAGKVKKGNLLPHMGLVMMKMGSGSAEYQPILDNGPPFHYIQPKMDFDEWWEQIVIVDQQKNIFSRKDLVLNVANKDGGAHIDRDLNKKYAALTHFNSIGWTYVSKGQEKEFSTKLELAAVRQIAHEVLYTLHDEFPYLFDLNSSYKQYLPRLK